MVGALQPLNHAAAQEGQGIPKHGATAGSAIEGGHPGETVGAGGEALEEMAHQVLVVVFPQDVQHEAIIHLHQGLNGPVFGDGHGDTRGIEAGLADPAGHHGATAGAVVVGLARRHHIQPAG